MIISLLNGWKTRPNSLIISLQKIIGMHVDILNFSSFVKNVIKSEILISLLNG